MVPSVYPLIFAHRQNPHNRLTRSTFLAAQPAHEETTAKTLWDQPDQEGKTGGTNRFVEFTLTRWLDGPCPRALKALSSATRPTTPPHSSLVPSSNLAPPSYLTPRTPLPLRWCVGDTFSETTELMATDETKRAAQEFLAAQFTEAAQLEEDRLNSQAAVALAPKVWKRVAETFVAQCEAWNAITKEESLTCKETILGDLRIRCAGKPDIITVHYDSKKLQVILKNTARLEHEGDSTFFIQGYNGGTEADISRNNQRANLEVVVLGELRVLAGIGRTAK
jgi:hypothetical protein